MAHSIYDISVKNIKGQDVSLSEYKDKAILIVNTASKCGFTPQYEGLENLYEKYKDKGFVVLGFPCNQFGGQEPGNNDEIQTFCETKFNIKFPMFAKVDVNGELAHPLFEFLKNQKKGIFGSAAIKWNFTKFLVNKKGKVVDRYGAQTKPEDIEADIQKVL